jgi:hypothetical protein
MLKGLQDVHRCVYLPSAAEKFHQMTGLAASGQNVLFLELPSAPLFSPGVGRGSAKFKALLYHIQ